MEPQKDLDIKRPASPLVTLLEKVTSFFLIIAGIMVLLLALVTTYGAARRYLFHSPDNNAYLIGIIMMLGCVVFALAHIQVLRKHITVDYASKYLPRVVRDWLRYVGGSILGLIFCVTLVWKNWENALFAIKSGERTITLFAVPVFPFYFSVVFGAALLCLVLLAQMLRFLVSLRRRTSELPIAKE